MPADRLIDDFLAAATAAADAATSAIAGTRHLGRVVTKADGSPNIESDRLAERAALEHLLPLGVTVISEEGFGAHRAPGPGEPWIALDPIDGTRNFLAGLPPYALSVGLVVDGTAVAGVVHEHASGRRWAGAAGRGATRNGRPIAPRPGTTLMVPSPDPSSPAVVPRGFHRLRISGCTAADLCAVADGAAGAWHDLDRDGTHAHDVAGALGVAAGAGCVVLAPDGGPLVLPTETDRLIKFVLAADEKIASGLLTAFAT